MSEPSADFPAAPTSLGWLAAHALDGADATPWRSAAFARAASEGLRSLAGGKRDPESDWNGFSKPFREISEHVAAIRDPLRTMEKPALAAGIGGTAGAALRDLAAPEESALSGMPGIGRALGDALQTSGSPFNPRAASWVETGNPSVRKSPVRVPVAPAKPLAPAHPSTPAAKAKPKAKPAPPDLAPLSRTRLPPAQTAFEAWAEKLDRKMRQARERDAAIQAAKSGGAKRPAAPMPPKRAPFRYPEDPADLARFKEILGRQAPTASTPPAGAMPPTPGASTPSDTVTPVAPPWPGAPAPADPGIGDILSRLPAPGPRPSGPDGNDLFTPVQPPLPARGTVPAPPLSAPPAPAAPQPSPVAPATPAGSAKPRPSEMEWLEEEDDLAARLHSLLRRQARRRGVDLS